MTNQNQAVDQGFLLLLLLCYFSPIIHSVKIKIYVGSCHLVPDVILHSATGCFAGTIPVFQSRSNPLAEHFIRTIRVSTCMSRRTGFPH